MSGAPNGPPAFDPFDNADINEDLRKQIPPEQLMLAGMLKAQVRTLPIGTMLLLLKWCASRLLQDEHELRANEEAACPHMREYLDLLTFQCRAIVECSDRHSKTHIDEARAKKRDSRNN